ncbi:hypothetical protein OH687_19510 [Burkholderia anthina]|nr:hypothetical protein OH687_19510 [Burkholderia anthina]
MRGPCGNVPRIACFIDRRTAPVSLRNPAESNRYRPATDAALTRIWRRRQLRCATLALVIEEKIQLHFVT